MLMCLHAMRGYEFVISVLLGMFFHHRRLGLLVSQQVRGDDAHFYQTLADRHSDESLPTLWKSLKPLLPRQAAKRRNNIRCIGPATSDIVAHFDALEAGEAIPYAQLLSDLSPWSTRTAP